MDKHEARKKLKEMRNSLSSAFVSAASAQICEQCKELLSDHSTIGIYMGVGNEVNTEALIRWCLNQHKRVCCPRVHGQTMAFYEITSLDDLKPGSFGLLEPSLGCLIEAKMLTCMVMPLVGFNASGQRIGQGKGYYDRYLNQCECFKIGLAFDCQKIAFQCESHDVGTDVIITEKYVYKNY